MPDSKFEDYRRQVARKNAARRLVEQITAAQEGQGREMTVTFEELKQFDKAPLSYGQLELKVFGPSPAGERLREAQSNFYAGLMEYMNNMAKTNKPPMDGTPYFMIYNPNYTAAMPRVHWDNIEEATTVAVSMHDGNASAGEPIFILAPVRVVGQIKPKPPIMDVDPLPKTEPPAASTTN